MSLGSLIACLLCALRAFAANLLPPSRSPSTRRTSTSKPPATGSRSSSNSPSPTASPATSPPRRRSRFANPALVEARQAATVYPVADGATEMTVDVRRADGEGAGEGRRRRRTTGRSPSSCDVMPVFMRAGCNVGGCHGAARGKDGFRLSLFGFDPDGDHYRLTREFNGRRINLALPAESPAARKGAAARCRTPAASDQGRRRVLPDAHPLARSRRPARPADRRHCR